MKINTVLGQVDTKDLGVTLMHEHIGNIDYSFVKAFGKDFFDFEETVRMFKEDMDSLKPYGVKTFVDATPINLGRNLDLMKACSEAAEVNIIAVTGVYYQEHPFYHYGCEPRVLADYMLRDLEKGMEGTDAKAAIAKCASQMPSGKSKTNEGMIRATAIAAREAHVPIYTHAEAGAELGLWQKEIFESEGVDFEHVAYGHTVRGTMDYILKLRENGAYVACDQLAFTTKQAVQNLAELVKSDKHRSKVFISADAAVRTDFGYVLDSRLRDREKNFLVHKFSRRSTIFERAIPAIKELGCTEEQIREVLVDNPRRYFEM